MKTLFLAQMAGLIIAPAGFADVLWNETTQGDLSNNRLAPTTIALGVGLHSLTATTGGGDLDYMAITLAPGTRLAHLVLVSYQGVDFTAFIGMQKGPTFTEAPENPAVGNLLGYAHFGPDAGNVGEDILDEIGMGFLAIGFTPPLPASTYSFWLQQLGAPCTYQMDFVVEAVPVACYANCDSSTIAPILNVNDFTCFLNVYAAGSSAANCDASTIPPILNVNDFTCFLNVYAAGCS